MKRIIQTLFITAISISVMAQDVANWRGPDRTGIYRETGLLKVWPASGPELIWSFEGLGDGHTSAAVTATGIFTTGMVGGNGVLYALDLNGKLKWKTEYGKEWDESHNGVRSTPLVINDKIYLFTPYGVLFCFNAANGNVVWKIDTFKEYGGRNITWGVTENLLYDGNTLFCSPGGADASIIAVDRNTGKLIWKSKAKGEKSAYCSPVMINHAGKKILVTMMETSVHGLDPANGQLLWSFEHTTRPFVHPNVPLYIDGNLFITTGYGLGSLMLKLSPDGKSVTEVWKNSSLDPKIGSVVVLNGKIYGGGDRNRKFFCLDWKTGEQIFALNQLAPCNVIANDGLLYIYSESGTITLAEPKADGLNIISSFKVPLGEGTHWAHPVIVNKKLYVRHGTALMVYKISA